MSVRDPRQELDRGVELAKEGAERAKEKIVEVKRSLASKIGRGVMWTIVAVVLLIVVLLGAFAWYTTTPDFERRVGHKVVSVLEDATGGRVELKAIHFDLRHLAIEVNGLIIHGLEGPAEAPYLSADRIFADKAIQLHGACLRIGARFSCLVELSWSGASAISSDCR